MRLELETFNVFVVNKRGAVKMTKFYDATKEHTKIEKSTTKSEKTKGHPNKGLKGKNPYTGKVVS
jgi:hypothetical protein